MPTSPWSYAIDLAVVVGTFILIGLGRLDWSHGLPLVTAVVGGQLMMRRPPPPPPPPTIAPSLPPGTPALAPGPPSTLTTLARVAAGSVLATVLFAVLFVPFAKLNHLLEHGVQH